MTKPSEPDPSEHEEPEHTMRRRKPAEPPPAGEAPPPSDSTRRAGDPDVTARRTAGARGKPPEAENDKLARDAQRTQARSPRLDVDATLPRALDGAPAPRARGAEGERTMRRTKGDEIDVTLVQSGKPEDDDPLIGTELGGCRIEKRIGAGGMGTVYRARQDDLERDVAIKTIRPEFATDTESLKRFQREAKAVGKFRTPHVVQIYAVGNERGIPFIVLEYLAGGSLRELAESKPDGRLAAPEAIRYLRESALALSDAASKELVHRDIKPDNLLLDENGVLKVTDFGISKMVQQDVSMTLTMGGIVGTPMYMSPEQCRGEDLDFRSDMWSLGATFFFLLTGQPPAKGSSLLDLIRTKNEVRNLDPSKILFDAIPGPLSEVIRRLTMLDRNERYASYDALIADLDAIEAGRRPARDFRPLLRAGLVLVVLGGAGFAVQQNWGRIRDFATGLFATAKVNPEPSGPGPAPVEPVIDWGGMETEASAIADGVDPAQDVSSLHGLTDRANALWTAAQALPPSARTDNLRAEITSARERIGTRTLQLRELEDRKGRLDQLARLRTVLSSDGDLPQFLRDVDNLIAQLPPGGAWDEVRSDAQSLRRDGAIKQFGLRVDAVREKFGSGGAAAAASLSESLVADLQKESAAGEFATLRRDAQALDSDIRIATALFTRLSQAPEVRYPFAEVGEWARSVNVELDSAAKNAKTEVLKQWCSDQRKVLLGDAALRARVLAEGKRVFAECLGARDSGDVMKVRELSEGLRAALPRVAGLDALAQDDVVQSTDLDGIDSWLAGRSARDKLLGDLTSASRAQTALPSIGAWLAQREASERRQKELLEEVSKLTLADDSAVKEESDRLAAEMAWWVALAARVDAALGDVAKARLEKARRSLTVRDVSSRDPASIPELAALLRAIEQLQQGFTDACSDLELEPATRQFQAAHDTLAQLPSALKNAASGAGYAKNCVERAKDLTARSSDMARVRRGQVKIQVDQPGVDGTFEVDPFFLDRFEVNRRVFKEALDAAAFPSLTQQEISELNSRDWSSRPELPAVGIGKLAAVDCLAYTKKALPKHAEWWLAAKGPGDNQDFPWGKDFRDGAVDQRSDPTEVQLDRKPLTVGERPVFFLIGNAAEWVENEFPEEGRATRGALVGGGFGYSDKNLRGASRGVLHTVLLTARVEANAGFRGVIRPREFFGALYPAAQ